MEIFDIAARSVIIYLFIILGIRIFGKREISQLSVIDLVFILLISNSVQNAMVGQNTSLVAGIMAAASLFTINRFLGMLVHRSKSIESFLEGVPIMLIYKGQIIKKHIQQADISETELMAAVREHGVENILNVDLAILEIDGNISVLSNNFHNRTTKKRKGHRVLEHVI